MHSFKLMIWSIYLDSLTKTAVSCLALLLFLWEMVFMLSSAHPEPWVVPPVHQKSSQTPMVPPEEPFLLCNVSWNRLQPAPLRRTQTCKGWHPACRRDMKKSLLHGDSFQHPYRKHAYLRSCVSCNAFLFSFKNFASLLGTYSSGYSL